MSVCLSHVSVVCCHVEISATGRSLVRRSPTDCDVTLCMIEKPKESGGPGPRWAVAPEGEKFYYTSECDNNLKSQLA